MASPSDTGPFSTQEANTTGGDVNAHAFLIEQIVNRMGTTSLVKVLAVNPPAAGGRVGTLDVQPMVHQVDGVGQPTPHGTIHDVPYFRYQGGKNAIILDPEVGDIGLALFCSHDSSTVKTTGQPSPPGSRRRFDMADALYIGGVLNSAPTQTVAFGSDGITITSLTAIIHKAPSIAMISPSIAFKGDALTHNGVNIGATHKHGGVQTGGGITSVPQ